MFGAAALLEFLRIVVFRPSFASVQKVEIVTVGLLVFGEFCQLVLQIEQSLEHGFEVSPVILFVTLSELVHPIDMLVENLPRQAGGVHKPALGFPVVSH